MSTGLIDTIPLPEFRSAQALCFCAYLNVNREYVDLIKGYLEKGLVGNLILSSVSVFVPP